MKKRKQIPKPIDCSGLRTTSLLASKRKVRIKDFARTVTPPAKFKTFWEDGLPDILAASNLKLLAKKIAIAHRRQKQVMLAMGAHAVKVGLSPLIIDFMDRGIITAFAGNGAAAIHDFEIALAGVTSEEVETAIKDGSFGTTRETAEAFRKVAARCNREDVGFGLALGEYILSHKLPYRHLSIFAKACELCIPATAHIALGTDIVHIHPGLDGAGLGKGSLEDFRIFASALSKLEQGVYINLGSAVVMPEVFLKAVSLVRNLGHKLENFTAANMDFIAHYRPRVNVLERPTSRGGIGINLIGHHEIMLPLLCAGVLEELKGGKQ